MSDKVKPPALFWVISIVALLWFVMGSLAYITSHSYTAEMLIPIYGEEGTRIILERPSWQVAVWAMAVFGGLIGSIGLLLRKTWSKFLFMASLIGALAYDVWAFTSGYFAHSTGFDKFIFLMAVIMPAFLIWFCAKKTAKDIVT